MKPINLVWKLQQHWRRFHQMHLWWARDPVQPELIQGLGTQKQFEQICFACNEICPCDSNGYNEGELGVCEFKSAEDWLLDAANAIGRINTVDLLTENVKIWVW